MSDSTTPVSSELSQFADKDRQNGFRLRRFNANFNGLADKNGIDATAAREFIQQVGLPPFNATEPAAIKASVSTWMDASKKEIAEALGIDWEGLTDFMEALAPLILEFMAACGV